MRVVDGMLDLLRDEGVDRVFGNPGTTELPFVGELAHGDLPYVLAPHEGTLVATADGYARATRRTSFVNLHVAAGLANGLIGMLNALRSRTPMVVTAGQQDSRHLIQDPMLSGDLVGLASSAAKWAVEVRRADEVGTVLRRAFRAAATPPEGPVFVSLPMDLLDEALIAPMPVRSVLAAPGPATDLASAVALLRTARAPAIVAGDGVGRAGGVRALVQIAEALGAPVWHAPMNDRLNFPMNHSQYAGMLAPDNAQIRSVLDGQDTVLLVGVRAFVPHHYSAAFAVGPGTALIQLDDDPAQLGRNYPVRIGLCGDVAATLDGLSAALARPRQGVATAWPVRRSIPVPDEEPIADGAALSPRSAAAAIAANLPHGAIVIEEAITAGLLLRECLQLSEPDSFHHTVGGGLGWGIGAAVGVSMGRPDRPVVAALGDGCALFGVHGLWTAARGRCPVTFVVFNNGEYRTLKQTLTRMRGATGPFVGMDLAPPAVDWAALSQSLGVRGVRATSGAHLGEVLAARTATDEPLLVEVPVS